MNKSGGPLSAISMRQIRYSNPFPVLFECGCEADSPRTVKGSIRRSEASLPVRTRKPDNTQRSPVIGVRFRLLSAQIGLNEHSASVRESRRKLLIQLERIPADFRRGGPLRHGTLMCVKCLSQVEHQRPVVVRVLTRRLVSHSQCGIEEVLGDIERASPLGIGTAPAQRALKRQSSSAAILSRPLPVTASPLGFSHDIVPELIPD